MANEIIFIADGRDFHAVDWYRNIKRVCPGREIYYATDLLEAEGQPRILNETDKVLKLAIVDKYLLKRQSSFGNKWRNALKVLFFPIQVLRLKKIAKEFPNAIFHAHTMYYLFISWLAGIKYIGSPQGAEILIRPYRSKLYRFFAVKSLSASEHLIVDSQNLRNGIESLCGKKADVIQYGIDVDQIQKSIADISTRDIVVSIRALYPLYRIHEIIEARNSSMPNLGLSFFYPFWEAGYKSKILEMSHNNDVHLGRMPTKVEVYRTLANSIMAISIPESDSSPRSVYESIFCGCCVVVADNPWINSLPKCMKSRVYIADLKEKQWFSKAYQFATNLVNDQFIPTEDALNMFDQIRSMTLVAKKYYRN